MPRKYERKSARQSWSTENMAAAIQDVIKGKMGYMKAAKTHGVPQSTLEDKVKKARIERLEPAEAAQKKLGRYTTVFSPAQEEELVNHVLDMKQRFCGLTLADICELAFDLAEVNKVPHNFNKDKKRAGKDWLYGFLKRHKEISLKNPEKNVPCTCEGS